MAEQQTVEEVADSQQQVEDTPLPKSTEPALEVESYEPPPEDPSGGDSSVAPPPSSGINFRIILFALLGILIIAGVIIGIMAFLGGGGRPGGGKIEIVYWGLWEPEEVVKTVIEDYERENPKVTIKYEMNSPIQYRERLQAALERGDGPDVFRFHNTWIPMIRSDLATVPETVMSAEEADSIFYEGIVRNLSDGGRLVGIPFGFDMLMLYYNKDLLSAQSISVPTSWEAFNDAATLLTKKDGSGRILQSGAAMGAAENIEHFSDIIGLMSYQNGVNFDSLNSQASVQTLTFYTLFSLEPTNVWDENQNNSIVAFAGGDVAMIFAPSWQVHNIKALNPNLNFATAPVPQLQGGTPRTWATYWVEGVSARSIHQEEAFKFIRYLSEKDTVTKLFAETSKLESRDFGEAYARIDLKDQLSENEYLYPIAEQADYAESWFLASRTQDNGINDNIIDYYKDAVNAILQGSSATGALSTVSSGVNQVLSEYGVGSTDVEQ